MYNKSTRPLGGISTTNIFFSVNSIINPARYAGGNKLFFFISIEDLMVYLLFKPYKVNIETGINSDSEAEIELE